MTDDIKYIPDLYSALYPGMRGEFEIAQRDPAYIAGHTLNWGYDGGNLLSRSWLFLTSFEWLLQLHSNPGPKRKKERYF